MKQRSDVPVDGMGIDEDADLRRRCNSLNRSFRCLSFCSAVSGAGSAVLPSNVIAVVAGVVLRTAE